MLNEAKGNGTSMISLILPPKSQVAQTQAMLANEYGTASNIKSRVNRQSVLGAITSAQQRLKLYTRVPTNGLIVYTGTVLTEDGKEKKMNIDFEPFKPINTSLYLCDNKFHTEALSELMETDSKYGFIIMDGNGSLFGTLSGNTRDVLHKFSVDLPKKHGRGGQSALRFARLRMEKRHNYVRKVAEMATQFFITNDRPNVAGLVLAGSADFKTELGQSDMFDQRLQAVIMAVVDVSYGERASAALGLGRDGWGGVWGLESSLERGALPISCLAPAPACPRGGRGGRKWQKIKWRLPHSTHPAGPRFAQACPHTMGSAHSPGAGTPQTQSHHFHTPPPRSVCLVCLPADARPLLCAAAAAAQAARTASPRRSSCRRRRSPTSSSCRRSACSPPSSTKSPRTRASSASAWATP